MRYGTNSTKQPLFLKEHVWSFKVVYIQLDVVELMSRQFVGVTASLWQAVIHIFYSHVASVLEFIALIFKHYEM